MINRIKRILSVLSELFPLIYGLWVRVSPSAEHSECGSFYISHGGED